MSAAKTALVTGAAGGIGAALCRDLAGRGYSVLAHARSMTKARSVGDYVPVWGDLTQDADVEAIARQAVGHGGVDLLVHNAGVLSRERAKGAHGFGIQGEVNVIAPYALTRAMRDAGGLRENAVVLVVSSTAANFARSTDYERLAEPDSSSLFGHYALSKAAANALTIYMAATFPDLTFVSVEPGFVATGMTSGNDHMPWLMRKLAPLAGATPEKATGRVLDRALAGDVASGSIIQGGKVVDGGKWRGEQARASTAALLARVGVTREA